MAGADSPSLPKSSSKSSASSLMTAVLRWLGSLKVAVGLLVVLAAILAVATFVEQERGHEYVDWYIYSSGWFIGLLALLAVNVTASALSRFPWKWRHLDFLVTHGGLLVVLAGAILTFVGGVEGRLMLVEGQTGDSILMSEWSQVNLTWDSPEGKQEVKFQFLGGPVDWTEGSALDLGEQDGARVKALKFYRHAKPRTDWVPSQSEDGVAAIRLDVTEPDGRATTEHWLTSEELAGQTVAESFDMRLLTVADAVLLEDFLDPPRGQMGPEGILSVHFQGDTHRFDVQQAVNTKTPLGETGASVEIVEYLPDWRPDGQGGFVNAGQIPRNPMVVTLIHVPGQPMPYKQVAFALFPTVDPNRSAEDPCPVKLWYHHPSVAPRPGVEFLQTPNDKLHCRVGRDDKWLSRGQVSEGDLFELGGHAKVRLLTHVPNAQEEVSFVSVGGKEAEALNAAALVEVTLGDHSEQVWLPRLYWRADPNDHTRTVSLGDRRLTLSLGHRAHPLGFSVKLLDFKHEKNQGGMGSAEFSSRVQVLDEDGHVEERATISMNQPLTYGKFTLYQSSYGAVGGVESSTLSASHDPGRFLKYLGSLVLSIGMVMVLLTRFQSIQRVWMKAIGWLAPLAVAFGATSAMAQDSIDWEPWRATPVLDQGRHKPLDTLAWEALRVVGNRGSFEDPKTNDELAPTPLYLAMLLDWQGWDAPSEDLSTTGPTYFEPHQADKWDKAPMILVNSLELRELFNTQGTKRVSAADIHAREITVPGEDQKSSFLDWAGRLSGRQGAKQELSQLESDVLAVANKYWLYQDHRMGRRLALIPLEGDEEGRWLPIGYLMHWELNDENDPKGRLRHVQKRFLAVRKAHLDGSAKEFNRASVDFLAAVRILADDDNNLPQASLLELEVRYNDWAPFRVAWVFTLLAFILLLFAMGSRQQTPYVLGWGGYVLGALAMAVGFWMRGRISGWAPLTNMYESVVYTGFGVALLGMILEAVHRARYVLTASAAVATLTLILADNCPTVMDPVISPVNPVLRSNYWLVVHVMTIMLGYAAFALALGISNITLGYFLVGSKNKETIAELSRFNYLSLLVGVLFLAVGTITGAIWADYAWGRFWGWDPKEVWALIALIGYLAVLHARFFGIRRFGMAALSVLCFTLVVMAWYGVNFVLGAGLHAYGSGGEGGQYYVFGALVLQWLYVAAAGLGYWIAPAAEDAPIEQEPIQLTDPL